ncbi:MAG TPA: 2-oxoisovalerate dehydrogenase [Acidobacteriota bacterium]|nr:2-oxoisovalerate dehydrogenase [Acidobacteriota bacterium]
MGQIGQNRKKAKKRDTEIIFLVEESPEGGYDARALGHSIFTQGETLHELREALKDAVRCHFNKKERPHLIRLHLVKEEVIPA